jgi:2-octaprenylphenol hydroxylase
MTLAPEPQADTLHDVIIIGGGLVGGLCALLLAEGGVQPVLLDAAPLLSPDVLAERDSRVFALSPACIDLLKRVGVWARITRHAPYQAMQVWHRDAASQLDFGQPDARHADWLGSMVEPNVLTLALQAQWQASGLTVHSQCRVQALDQYSDHWRVTLSDGRVLRTALLIGADGANSMVRRAADIVLDRLDYGQSAVTCAIRTERPHGGVARQVFLPTGPLALLPMADVDDPEHGHWQSIVWTLPTDDATALSALDDAALMQALGHASGYVLGAVQQVQSRGLFALKAQQAQHYVQAGLALIGDAAHVVHPMAGQGVNLGILDAAVLVDALLHDRTRGLWAHSQTLNRYARTRRLPNSLMMHSLSMLGWLQSATHPAVMWVRGEGMQAVAGQPWLRTQLTAQASGRSSLHHTRYAD